MRKKIPGFERYEVDEYGNIYSSAKGKEKILKCSTFKLGYKGITLGGRGGKKEYVHRLVAFAFIPNPESKPHVNHIDGVTSNNVVSNLEWCTHKENIQHASRTGLLKSGEDKYNSKLSHEDCKIIFQLFRNGESANSIAKKYKISGTGITFLLKGKSYKKCGEKPFKDLRKRI